MKQGAPKEKLMIGMPTYGRSFTLVDKDKFDIGAPASGGGVAGNFTNESGFLSYYEVCSIISLYYSSVLIFNSIYSNRIFKTYYIIYILQTSLIIFFSNNTQ